MDITVAHFNDLSRHDLHNIIKMRLEIYVVEQGWRYQDLDGLDLDAYMVQYKENGNLIGTSRIYEMAGDVWIGRVLVTKSHRRRGLGSKIMAFNIDQCKQLYPDSNIKLLSPLSIKSFYQKFNFVTTGDLFHDEGVPYIEMISDNFTL